MSTIIAGNPGNITTPLTRSITSIANNGSGACRVATSVAHLFGNGDTVRVTGTSNAQLDGNSFVITVIDASHFDLAGTTFTFTATGTAVDLSITPQVQVPSDGDAATMNGSLLSSLQACLDRTQYINQRVAVGTHRLVGNFLYSHTVSPPTGTQVTTWSNISLGTSPWELTQVGHNDQGASRIQVMVGDIIDVAFTADLFASNFTASATTASVQISYLENGGAIAPFPGTPRNTPVSTSATAAGLLPSAFSSQRVVASTSVSQFFGIYVDASTPNASVTVVLADSWSCYIRQWRAN